mmetsp:Transcript_146919/g.258987  ORF Transcript_146919/g.258987 Transcript_146919/m.258987 type:complete len:158 (-) Transcript_146919:122-595(-)
MLAETCQRQARKAAQIPPMIKAPLVQNAICPCIKVSSVEGIIAELLLLSSVVPSGGVIVLVSIQRKERSWGSDAKNVESLEPFHIGRLHMTPRTQRTKGLTEVIFAKHVPDKVIAQVLSLIHFSSPWPFSFTLTSSLCDGISKATALCGPLLCRAVM